ncbi:Scr1 family TA system antitoxin-like transcriptional regulator [Streptomyces sp. NPDC006367]|uniref:Scr1 family TA system antitoxin-like transcriptional regulator n=1 Tax=unclassified Streptomyces TaxID=2593676 RepID=UPI0033A8FF49
MTSSDAAARALVMDLLPPARVGHACEGDTCREASVADVVVGAGLRAARAQAGVSAARAAACVGLREARITRLEAAQTVWSAKQVIALARLYQMPDGQVEELRQLLGPGHHHSLPDLGAHPGPRLAALESRAVRIRVAAQSVPLFFYGWGGNGAYLTDCPAAGPPAVRPRPWPDCPVTLIWDELTLGRGYIDAPRTVARLRHLADMVEAGALTVRILIPDYHQPFEPVGSELTFGDDTTVCVSEELFLVMYSNGPRARAKSALLDRQLAAALSPDESLAALRRAAERWSRA